MAEPLFLDEDSPFAEYHRQDEQQQRQPSPISIPPLVRTPSANPPKPALNPNDDELFELSARMPPPPPRRPSYSSTSSPRNSSRPQSVASAASSQFPVSTLPTSSASSATARQRSRANSATKRKSPHRNSEGPRETLDRGRIARPSDILEVAASIPRQVSPLPSDARLTAPNRPPPQLVSEPHMAGTSNTPHVTALSSRKTVPVHTSFPARLGSSVAVFFHDLYRAIVMVFSFILSSTTSVLPFGPRTNRTPASPASPAGLDGSGADKSAGTSKSPSSLAERFKYVVCTSFLLTPTMSISFYDEGVAGPGVDATSPDTKKGRRASVSSSVLVYSVGLPSSSQAAFHPSQGSRSPPRHLSALQLTSSGARLQRAFVSSLAILAYLASDWEAWFRTSLLLACIVLTIMLTPGAGLLSTEWPDVLSYSLDTEPFLSVPMDGPRAANLLRTAVPGVLRSKQKDALADEIVAQAHSLVLAAQALDRGVSGAITAIKEVELVARGYKITKPMPPISRIEAASSTFASTQAKNASRESSRLSLTSSLTPGNRSGISSPTPGASNRSLAPPPAEAHRVASLRKVLVHTFESADHACRIARQRLEPLAEKDEMGLLRGMYGLDGTADSDGGGEPRQGQDESDPSDSLQGTSSDQLARARREAVDRLSGSIPLSSFNAHASTLPRNYGSKRHSRSSAFGESLLSDANDPNRAAGSSSGPKRLSLLSDLSASDRDRLAALGRTSPRPSGPQGFSAHDGSPAGSRLSRLQYKVSDSASGPNDSAAAKRASYTSSSSMSYAPSPVRENRYSVNASRPTSPTGGVQSGSLSLENHVRQILPSSGFPSSPGGSSINGMGSAAAGGLYGAGGSITPSSRPTSVSFSGDRKHLSNTSGINVFASLRSEDANASSATGDRRSETFNPQAYDAFTLLNLQGSFEALHSERRQALVPLLALDLSLKDPVSLGAETMDSTQSSGISLRVYWDEVLGIMADLESVWTEERLLVEAAVREAMGLTLLGGAGQGGRVGAASDEGARLGDAAGVPHPGLEGCVGAMGTSLRTVQAKLVACAEACRIQTPELLHGDLPVGTPTTLADVYSTERLFDSMRQDLLALCAEWESGVKMLRVARVRTAADASRSVASSPSATQGAESDWALWTKAPGAPSVDSSGRPVNGLRSTPPSVLSTLRQSDSTLTSSEGDSPRDLREGEAARNVMYEDLGGKSNDIEGKDYSADGELQDLLLNSTSPAHLPPAGLEQVYESAALPSASAAPRSLLSRDERIRVLKEQRAAESARQTRAREEATKEEQAIGAPPVQMVRELEDVMRVLRAKRESIVSVGNSNSTHSVNGSSSPLQVEQSESTGRLFGRTSPHPHSLDVVAESKTESEEPIDSTRVKGRERMTSVPSGSMERSFPGTVPRSSTGSLYARPVVPTTGSSSPSSDSIDTDTLPPARPRPRPTSTHNNRLSAALNGQVYMANRPAALNGSSGHSATSSHSPSTSVSLSEAEIRRSSSSSANANGNTGAHAGRTTSISKNRSSKSWAALGGLAEERADPMPTTPADQVISTS